MEDEVFPGTEHRLGLAVIGLAGLLSALSTSSLLIYIAWTAFSPSDKLKPFPRGLRTFTISSLAWYLISLLLCDFFQGVAFALNFHWAADGLMRQGKICAIQGIVSQIGDLGTAIWTTAITFHTFWLLFLAIQPHKLTVLLVLISGWSIIILLPILGPSVIQQPSRGSFYALTGAWCWIGDNYSVERGWIFGALFLSFILYTLICLRFSGVIKIDETGKIRLHLHQPVFHPKFPSPQVTCNAPVAPGKTEDEDPDNGFFASNVLFKRIARRIMWYPLLYAVVVIPVSICRMGMLAGWEPPFGLLVFAGICFGSSGLSNTILFLTTRKSFCVHENNTSIISVRVTTHHASVPDYSANKALEPSKFSGAQFVSGPSSTKDEPVILSSGHSSHIFKGDDYSSSN